MSCHYHHAKIFLLLNMLTGNIFSRKKRDDNDDKKLLNFIPFNFTFLMYIESMPIQQSELELLKHHIVNYMFVSKFKILT